MKIAGIDIGGAHIKFALLGDCLPDRQGVAVCREIEFPIWKRPDMLGSTLTAIHGELSWADRIAVTMTAELADCFSTKKEGVEFIVDAVENAFSPAQCKYYTTDGRLVAASLAKENWRTIAASNWHASAWFLFNKNQIENGFLIDIGSTTTDIIPVQNGHPAVPNQTDFNRLSNGQLLYAGVGRTPISSLLDSISLDRSTTGIARENFATTSDAMTYLGLAPPNEDDSETADGRPRTIEACRSRLSRMVCADPDELSDGEIESIAKQTLAKLQHLIAENVRLVTSEFPDIPHNFCLAGGGVSLGRRVVEKSFSQTANTIQTFDTSVDNQAIPAIAVAWKWHEEAQMIAQQQ